MGEMTPEARARFNERGRQWAKQRALELILDGVPKALLATTPEQKLAADRTLGRALELGNQHGFKADVIRSIGVLLKGAKET